MSPDVGSHQFLEEKLGHSTQRVGCMLHFGELPPKNLMKSDFVDGPTKGPEGTGGPLGVAISRDEHIRQICHSGKSKVIF